MIPKFRVLHKPMQIMGEVLAISFERQKVKIRHLRGTTHMTVPFDDVELMQVHVGLWCVWQVLGDKGSVRFSKCWG